MAHEILNSNYEPYICPKCGKTIMSDDTATCATLDSKHYRIFHEACLTTEDRDLLDKMGYDLFTDDAESFED